MVQRTCLDCGEAWTLTASLAHLRPRRSRRAAGRFGASPWAGNPTYRASGQGAGYAADASADLDQQLEMIREARTCPKCSSEHYQDRPA
jgi:ribosomal protein S27AE